tara:strand:+ start:1335 stop:2186 length:852 start_codon:yes stop_codon:yes gene_type:complete
MKKDLIVTTISGNYQEVDIKNWIHSIKNTGFPGDVLVIGYNFEKDNLLIKKLNELGCIVLLPDNDYRGNIHDTFLTNSGQVTPSNANKLVHNVRLFHLWQYLTETGDDSKYRRIIFTDGRDVIFQTNPSDWLDSNMVKDILVPSEGVTYRNENWNRNNAVSNYGPYVYEYILKDRPACNVGTFAINASICKDFCLTLYLMSNNIGHADQPSFNILTSTLLKDKCQWVDYNDSWALQVGAIIQTLDNYIDIEDNIIKNKSGEPYCLVHQYDRVPALKNYYDTVL